MDKVQEHEKDIHSSSDQELLITLPFISTKPPTSEEDFSQIGELSSRSTNDSDSGYMLSYSGTDESEENETEVCCVEGIVKTPGWRQLSGDLAKYTEGCIYDKMLSKLYKIKNCSGKQSVIPYLNSLLKLAKQESMEGLNVDFKVMCLVQGYFAAARVSGNDNEAMKQMKNLEKSLYIYNIMEKSVTFALSKYRLFLFYIDKGKPGKAWKYLNQAVINIQSESPSSWTAQMYNAQADLADYMAHIKPTGRKIYQQEAIKYLKKARDHHLYHCDENSKYLPEPIFYTMRIACITLDMPTQYTIRNFYKKRITFKRGLVCNITMNDVNEADRILSTVKQEVLLLDKDRPIDFDERIAVILMFRDIRQAQLFNQSGDLNLARKSLENAMETYRKWETVHKDRNTNRWRMLSTDLQDVLKELDAEIPSFHKQSLIPTESQALEKSTNIQDDVKTEEGEFSEQYDGNNESLSSDF